MEKRPKYISQLTSRDGLLGQEFKANYVVVEKHDEQWLLAFGDLIGPDALGDERPPAHSLLVYVGPEEGSGASWRLSVEFNDQGNTRCDHQLDRFEVYRTELRIRTAQGEEFMAGRVSYVPDADPFSPEADHEGQLIRGLRVQFQCGDATYKKIQHLLGYINPGNWLVIHTDNATEG